MQFSSINDKDVPWRAGQKIELWPSRYDGTPASMVARPNFQHNPTNPILTEFRLTLTHYQDKALCLKHYIEYVTYGDVYGWGHRERFHAQKVLTRLANLTNDKEN